MQFSRVSRVQCLNSAGIALLSTGGQAVVLRAPRSGLSVAHDAILCCGGATSVCDVCLKGGAAMVFAERDASGERGWLVLQTAAGQLKPLPQVAYNGFPARRCGSFVLHVATVG